MYIYIRSMSEAQTEVYRDIKSASDQIIIHVLKLLLFPDSGYADHWMHEIWSFLHIVKKLKGSNRWPKAAFIKKALSTGNDMIPQYIVLAIDDEEELEPVTVSASDALTCVELYQDWISATLSHDGVARQADVKNKLREICNL